MQTTKSKTTTPSLQLKTTQGPFFQQERNGDFMERSNACFFSTGGTQQPFFTKPTLQPKLTIGQPGDKYEQEADQMADQVVQRLAAHNTTPNATVIQPKCATCQEEEKLQQKEEPEKEEKLQKKPIFESNAEPPELPIQTKLEKTSSLQKKCDECTTKEEMPGVQRAADSTGTPSASSSLESRLSSSRGSGSPLPENTRSQMEGAFGSDFSGVRVHTDSSAVQMNQELSAQAFTHGSDVYFNEGKYDTGSREGQRLLGHELTHVVQQGGGMRHEKVQRRRDRTNERLISLENKTNALSVLVQFQAQILSITTGWENAARDIGSAYAIAANRHQQAIQADQARAAIEGQIMAGILSAVTAGGFSWITASIGSLASETHLLNAPLQRAATGGVEQVLPFRSGLVDRFGQPLSASPQLVDLRGRPLRGRPQEVSTQPIPSSPQPSGQGFDFTEAGSESVQQGLGLSASSQSQGIGREPVNMDPLLFQNERLQRVGSAKQNALDYIANLSSQLRMIDQNWMLYNAEEQLRRHQEWLSNSTNLRGGANLPSIGTMANEFERGFWAEWSKGVRANVSYAVMPIVDYPQIRAGISERFRVLGIASAAELELSGFTWFSHGYLFYDSTYHDWQNLKAWAESFRMPRFDQS